MQVLDRSRLMAIPPIWRLGFRPFFLGGALFAVLAIALWLAALAGLWSGWQPVGGWLAWHRHEMLFGFGVAIIAGFLLTAVQTWTGVPGLQGKPLALLAGLWLAARLAWLFDAPLALLLVLQLSFLPLLAWAIGRSLWRVRQKRNYPVVGLLLLLTLADALVLLGLFEGNDDWQRRASIAALWLIAGMMNLIGGRVIPFFTQRGLGRQQQVPAIAWLDNGILLGCVLVALLTAAGVTTQPTPWLAGLFAASVVRNCGACGVGAIAASGRCRCSGLCTWHISGSPWRRLAWRSGAWAWRWRRARRCTRWRWAAWAG
ncbi:putative membraine protein [Pseudomonas aeruginosa]|nr:putative membraine protein [Pseudomonas aeruginosa]